MNRDDYDELNNLIRDNYTGETELTLKGEILPYRTEVGFTVPQQNEGKVLIYMKGGSFLENVEKDIGAFESLAFVIRRWTEFSKISLRWDNPYDLERHAPEHYQGFLYRVRRISECYPWFSVDDSSNHLLGKLLIMSELELLLDHPRYDAHKSFLSKPLDQLNSNDFEEYIWSNQIALNELIGTRELSRGLPLRVYIEDKPANIYLFPKEYSMIDLWGLSNNSNILSIIKLKGFTSGSRLSIVSELLFNTMVMRDALRGLFIYSMDGRNIYKGRGQYFTIPNAGAINSYILSRELPGLIDEELIRDMNEIESPDIPIKFGYISIDSKFNMKREF